MYLQEILTKGYLNKCSDKLLTSPWDLLGTLVLLPNCLLGMLRSIEVKVVQIVDAWEQIFQGVSSRLYQRFGLGTTQGSICISYLLEGLCDSQYVLNTGTQYSG